jgi:hypothetical protein
METGVKIVIFRINFNGINKIHGQLSKGKLNEIDFTLKLVFDLI